MFPEYYRQVKPSFREAGLVTYFLAACTALTLYLRLAADYTRRGIMDFQGAPRQQSTRAALFSCYEREARRLLAVEERTALLNVFIAVREQTRAERLRTELARSGFHCLPFPKDGVIEQPTGQSGGVALLEMEEEPDSSRLWELASSMRQEMNTSIIALVSKRSLDGLNSTHEIDDFVVEPWEANEITARIRRLAKQKSRPDGEDTIRCADLTIDSAKCEVSLGGKAVVLTFREYQLLKFLANNRGKVFSRETLLNKVWGWDYYGGDRTVDVHIRRLRSKIEDTDRSFIETVRNIGYRFVEPRP
jgi:two-component system alkaline phosphatase synthesis response regulator PhoP